MFKNLSSLLEKQEGVKTVLVCEKLTMEKRKHCKLTQKHASSNSEVRCAEKSHLNWKELKSSENLT